MSRIIFVTTELHPDTPGGAGVVIDALTRRLATTRECVVVLLGSPPEAAADHPGVEVLRRPIPATGFLERAEAVAKAVADIAMPEDRVEFHDFEGIGYLALAHRIDLGLDRTALTVRFHGPYDLLSDAMETAPTDWDLVSAMEREAFRMADLVLVPVQDQIQWLIDRYGLDPDRIGLAPPPVPKIGRVDRKSPKTPTFAVVGRLGEMKGSQDAVRAALTLLERGTSLVLRFVGGDGWSPTNTSTMREWIESLVATTPHPNAFQFTGPVDRSAIAAALSDVTAVVVPSRFESFCLAAHEARRLGHPVIVPDLPAFHSTFHPETGALVFDGSVEDLGRAMQQLIDDPELVARLADAPPPAVGDPMEPYQTDPRPRHPRAQAGLATAAAQRLDALWEEKKGPTLLQELYRLLPDGLARVLRKAAPRGLKQRAKALASWPLEQERRALSARLDLVADRIRAGEFPELENPEVTVVITVFNDTRYLEETLASVYEQTHRSWEIVVVDDGSTDETAIAYLDTLDRPRLRVIRQENKGLPGARNTGISIALGRYVVPLDADDQLEPDYMSQMVTALEAFPRAAYAHCYARLHHDIDAIWVTRPFNPYWQLLGNGVVGCVLLRKDAWETVGGYDETMNRGNEDWELWLRLMKHRWGQVQVPQVLFRYRKHGISMSVDTESRFEEGRRMVRDRHPDLYQPERIRRFKRRWYPLVTLITDLGGVGHGDIEVVESLDGLSETWGKYVADLRGIDPLPLDLVMSMASALESNPKAARAVTRGLPPVMLLRRWNLHDPGATPDGVIVVDDPIVGREVEIPAHLPRPGWSVPEGLGPPGVAIQRQPPEEAGSIPDPERW